MQMGEIKYLSKQGTTTILRSPSVVHILSIHTRVIQNLISELCLYSSSKRTYWDIRQSVVAKMLVKTSKSTGGTWCIKTHRTWSSVVAAKRPSGRTVN